MNGLRTRIDVQDLWLPTGPSSVRAHRLVDRCEQWGFDRSALRCREAESLIEERAQRGRGRCMHHRGLGYGIDHTLPAR